MQQKGDEISEDEDIFTLTYTLSDLFTHSDVLQNIKLFSDGDLTSYRNNFVLYTTCAVANSGELLMFRIFLNKRK